MHLDREVNAPPIETAAKHNAGSATMTMVNFNFFYPPPYSLYSTFGYNTVAYDRALREWERKRASLKVCFLAIVFYIGALLYQVPFLFGNILSTIYMALRN